MLIYPCKTCGKMVSDVAEESSPHLCQNFSQPPRISGELFSLARPLAEAVADNIMKCNGSAAESLSLYGNGQHIGEWTLQPLINFITSIIERELSGRSENMGNTKGIDGVIKHALPFDLKLRSSEKGYGLVGEEELWVIAPDAFHNRDVLFRIQAMCNRIRAEALNRGEGVKDLDYGL